LYAFLNEGLPEESVKMEFKKEKEQVFGHKFDFLYNRIPRHTEDENNMKVNILLVLSQD
jgi:hypothetical protein